MSKFYDDTVEDPNPMRHLLSTYNLIDKLFEKFDKK